MVKSCIVYMQNMSAEQIGEEKRACILEALKRQLPVYPLEIQKELDASGRAVSLYGICPRCRAAIHTPDSICKVCGMKITWKDETE